MNVLACSLAAKCTYLLYVLYFSFSQIQSADVLKELQNLDPYKSAGLDNLDSFFLKLSVEIVATPITSLFNLSFVSSEIPKDWKAAEVTPLPKLL